MKRYATGRADGESMSPCLEALEPRMHLSGTIAELESPSHTVVQLRLPPVPVADDPVVQIEMFDDEAPEAVAAFLTSVRTGALDESFFHRESPGEWVEGGVFTWDTVRGLGLVTPGAEVDAAFTRSNAAWTVALVRDPQAGVLGNRFVINLADNSAEFDSLGYVVIGVVLPSSRATLQAFLDATVTRDLTASSFFAGDFAGEFGAIPVNEINYAGGPPVQFTGDEDRLLHFADVEIVKAAAADRFYEYAVWYPEGFAGATISEFVPIVNPNDQPVYFQLIARFETGVRDLVIAEGVIAPNTRGGVTISTTENPEAALVPQGRPYALELHSTLPVGAVLSHYDFGSATGEAFTSEVPGATFFAGVDMRTDVGVRSFLVWLARVDGEVSVTFIGEDGEYTLTVQSEELRRGGLSLQELAAGGDVPTGIVDIIVRGAVTAALTTYVEDGSPAAPRGDGYATTSLGVAGRAEMVGFSPETYRYFIDLEDTVIPLVQLREGIQERVDLFNPGDEPTTVTLLLVPEDPQRAAVTADTRVVAPRGRVSIDLSTLEALPDGGRYTLVIRSDNGVAAQHLRFNDEDAAATRPASQAATLTVFGEGFMDPGRAGLNVFETLSIFNPNSSLLGAQDADATVTVLFRYTDGFTLTLEYTVAAGRSLHIDIHDLEEVLDQGRWEQRYFYGIEVSSTKPVVAQLEHFDLTLGTANAAGGFGALGVLMGEWAAL